MTNINRLDAAWASMTPGDRFVILGHDRPYLDDADKVRLAAVIEARANRGTGTPSIRTTRRTRRTPTPV